MVRHNHPVLDMLFASSSCIHSSPVYGAGSGSIFLLPSPRRKVDQGRLRFLTNWIKFDRGHALNVLCHDRALNAIKKTINCQHRQHRAAVPLNRGRTVPLSAISWSFGRPPGLWILLPPSGVTLQLMFLAGRYREVVPAESLV